MEQNNANKSSKENKVINIKVENKEQIISSYSYDKNDKLNKELSEFIIEKSKRTLTSKKIQLNFYSNEPIDKEEIESIVHTHFNEEKLATKDELKKSNIFILVMLAFGILTLATLVAMHNGNFSNFYFEMVLEISAWVFIWESVNNLFLERPKIRRCYIKMKKLSVAEVKTIFDFKDAKGNKHIKK